MQRKPMDGRAIIVAVQRLQAPTQNRAGHTELLVQAVKTNSHTGRLGWKTFTDEEYGPEVGVQ
jgi:hypothetical protein